MVLHSLSFLRLAPAASGTARGSRDCVGTNLPHHSTSPEPRARSAPIDIVRGDQRIGASPPTHFVPCLTGVQQGADHRPASQFGALSRVATATPASSARSGMPNPHSPSRSRSHASRAGDRGARAGAADRAGGAACAGAGGDAGAVHVARRGARAAGAGSRPGRARSEFYRGTSPRQAAAIDRPVPAS
jgi:hypothetical protein